MLHSQFESRFNIRFPLRHCLCRQRVHKVDGQEATQAKLIISKDLKPMAQ